MDQKVSPCPRLEGEVTVPGDKSISHRAVILNSLARGEAHIVNFSPGEDCLSTLACLRSLGVAFEERQDGSLLVRGSRLREPEDVLNAGNSGTTLRFLAGLLAGQPFLSILTGDSSLRSRPMARIVEPLRLMGAQLWGRSGDTLAPLVIRGSHLRGISYRLPVASAQVKSALLLAGLFARGETVLEEPAASRDHTELMLQAMGAPLKKEGLRVTLVGPVTSLSPLDVRVPGDMSAAAFWLVAGALHPRARVRVTGVGLNPTRTGVLEVLQAMGARLSRENRRREGGEEVADLVVESSALRAVEIGGDLIPRLIDELPVLALAATQARGTAIIRDAAELRVKESDRIATTAAELRRLGARVEERPDGMVIHGPTALKGATVDSHGDHRLALTLGVAALIARGETIVQGADVADISYPGFWSQLERLARGEG